MPVAGRCELHSRHILFEPPSGSISQLISRLSTTVRYAKLQRIYEICSKPSHSAGTPVDDGLAEIL